MWELAHLPQSLQKTPVAAWAFHVMTRLSVLRRFEPDFSDCLVPDWHFTKFLEYSGIRCNALILMKLLGLAGIPRNA